MSQADESAWTPGLVLAHLNKIIEASDKRYIESFASSEKAVAVAFSSSEKATAAAFAASEKAIRDTLAAVEKSTAAAFVAAEKAVALAEANAERWREDAKIWRTNVTERERDFASKTEVNALKERLDRGEGTRGGNKETLGWVVSGVMTLVALGSLAVSLFGAH